MSDYESRSENQFSAEQIAEAWQEGAQRPPIPPPVLVTRGGILFRTIVGSHRRVSREHLARQSRSGPSRGINGHLCTAFVAGGRPGLRVPHKHSLSMVRLHGFATNFDTNLLGVIVQGATRSNALGAAARVVQVHRHTIWPETMVQLHPSMLCDGGRSTAGFRPL